MKRKGNIVIVRTEQWEWTAKLGKVCATGSSATVAELHLLRFLVFGDQSKTPKEERTL